MSRRYKNKSRRRRKSQQGGDQPIAPLRCQCSPDCTRPVKKGEPFCAVHWEHGCERVAPLSGAEPTYDPDRYNKDKAVQHSHNCHAYAMDVIDPKKVEDCRTTNNCRFHVAGRTKGHSDFEGNMGKTCSDVTARTMADIPNAYLTNFESKCDPNYSKIAVVVDKENDLHYYRQDKPHTDPNILNKLPKWAHGLGFWSHKNGARVAHNKDAAGALMYDPQLASRYYAPETPGDSGLNYASFCSYMCVPRDKSIKLAGGKRSKKTRRRSRTKRS
jgi:hypothetical protein